MPEDLPDKLRRSRYWSAQSNCSAAASISSPLLSDHKNGRCPTNLARFPSRQSSDCRSNRHSSRSTYHQDTCERRSEEHTSELQSRFGISYAVFCLEKK